MNKIISSGDADALERLREKNQRDIRKPDEKISAEAEKRLRAAAESNNTVAEEVTTAGHRLTLRHERALQGLLAVRALFDQPADEREARLTALIEATRFQDEAVLGDYERTLRFAVRDDDRAAVDYLVRDFQDKLQASARDQVIRENLQAASSLMPEELLKDVVRALRQDGVPQVSIAPQRALELLRAL
jgi:ribosomal protein L17